MAIEPLDSLTRICLARQLSPETWLRLFKEAKAKSTSTEGKDDPLPLDIHIEALDCILPLVPGSNSSLAQSYLQACLVADGPKKHLLSKLFEAASNLAPSSDNAPQDSALFESLAAALLASDPALVSKVQPEKTVQAAFERLQAVLKLLSMAARAQISSLFVLSLQLLQLPLPQYERELVEDELKRSTSQGIASCRAALSAMTGNLPALPYPVEMAHKDLNKLERMLDPIASRRSTFIRPPSFPSIPAELELLLQMMLYNNCVGAASALRGSIAARIAVQRAISDDTGKNSQQDLLNQWLGDLFQACSNHASLQDEPKDRSKARWRAFTFGRLPGLLAEVRGDPLLSHLEADWSAAIDEGLQICLQRRKETGMGDLTRWFDDAKAYMRKQAAKEEAGDRSTEDLVSLLQHGLDDYSAQQATAAAVASQVSKWTSNSDLPAVQHFLLSIIKETPRILDYVLLHCSPEALFKPICRLLDIWDSFEEYGAGPAMELYGGILLGLQTIIRRHSLQDTFTAFGYSITSSIIASPGSSGEGSSLRALSDQHRKLVSSWITALYGSEGIEDELIRSTPPQAMLVLAPTLVHQSMTAMENGIIDQETLVNGLSYFCQDFLTFALPGVLSYLAQRPQPNIQVIKSLLASDSTQAYVLELVQDDLRVMLNKLDSTSEEYKGLKRRLNRGAIATSISKATLSSGLSTGLDVAQNLRGSFEAEGTTGVMTMLALAQDPFMASLYLSQCATS